MALPVSIDLSFILIQASVLIKKMDGFEAALDAYTMPQQRLARPTNLAPLGRKAAEVQRVPQHLEDQESPTQRFVRKILGPRSSVAIGQSAYVEKPGGVRDVSAMLMEERRQRENVRRKQAELEELLVAINAQTIQHEAHVREKKIPLAKESHGLLAAVEAQKWMAVRCEQTERLFLEAGNLVKQSRESRKEEPRRTPSAGGSSALFPSRGRGVSASLCGSLLMHPLSRGDGQLSSIGSTDGVVPHHPIPVTEWFSESPPQQARSELAPAGTPWNSSTCVAQTPGDGRKAALLVPGQVEDVPANEVEEVLRVIHSDGVAAARPRTFVSQVVCALHTYGSSIERSRRLQAVGPLLRQVKVPPPRKSFRDILQAKRLSEAHETEIQAQPQPTEHSTPDSRSKPVSLPGSRAASSEVKRQTPREQTSRQSSRAGTQRGNTSGKSQPLLPPVRSGRAPLPKPMRKSHAHSTSELFEALAAQSEGGRTRQSDEASYAHSDFGWRSGAATPDGREDAEVTSLFFSHDTTSEQPYLMPNNFATVAEPVHVQATTSMQATSVPPASEDPGREETVREREKPPHSAELSPTTVPESTSEREFVATAALEANCAPLTASGSSDNPDESPSKSPAPAAREPVAASNVPVSTAAPDNAEAPDGTYDAEFDEASEGEMLPHEAEPAHTKQCHYAQLDDDEYGSSDFEASSPQQQTVTEDVSPTPEPIISELQPANPPSIEPEAGRSSAEPDEYEDDNDFDAESPKNEDEARRVAQLKAELRVASADADGCEDDMYSDDGFDEAAPHRSGDPVEALTDAEGDAYASQLSAALRQLKGGASSAPEGPECVDAASATVVQRTPVSVVLSPPKSAEPRPDSQRRGGRTSRHGTGGGTKTGIQYTARDFFGDGITPEVTLGELGAELDQIGRPTSRASVSTAGDHRTGQISPVSESVPDSSRGGRGGKERVVSLEIGNFEEIDVGAFPSKRPKKSKRKTSDSSVEGTSRRGRKSGSQGLDL
jgi:hypothetical protein